MRSSALMYFMRFRFGALLVFSVDSTSTLVLYFASPKLERRIGSATFVKHIFIRRVKILVRIFCLECFQPLLVWALQENKKKNVLEFSNIKRQQIGLSLLLQSLNDQMTTKQDSN